MRGTKASAVGAKCFRAFRGVHPMATAALTRALRAIGCCYFRGVHLFSGSRPLAAGTLPAGPGVRQCHWPTANACAGSLEIPRSWRRIWRSGESKRECSAGIARSPFRPGGPAGSPDPAGERATGALKRALRTICCFSALSVIHLFGGSIPLAGASPSPTGGATQPGRPSGWGEGSSTAPGKGRLTGASLRQRGDSACQLRPVIADRLLDELLGPSECGRRHHHLPDTGRVLAVVVAH